jgi:integrator complex subunit 6
LLNISIYIDTHPKCLSNFAFDKLELESSPLTVAMLERKRPDLCWQVFVENSGKFGGIGKPIGYLKVSLTFLCPNLNLSLLFCSKPNSQNTMVNLFIHPYNYEEALCLIEDLFRSNMSPTPIWRKQWDEYLANIPNYYISHFRY